MVSNNSLVREWKQGSVELLIAFRGSSHNQRIVFPSVVKDNIHHCLVYHQHRVNDVLYIMR